MPFMDELVSQEQHMMSSTRKKGERPCSDRYDEEYRRPILDSKRKADLTALDRRAYSQYFRDK